MSRQLSSSAVPHATAQPFLSQSFGYGARRKSSTKSPQRRPTREPAAMTQRGGGSGWRSMIFLYSASSFTIAVDFFFIHSATLPCTCLLYTSDAADERSSVDLGG